ncbi:MAG TPA: hypothetical protein PLM07_07575 [Candidatus Rifleibacterium sp.]|nr:hypothetical protein [Candidatus Rifleibacterium sp.]HPT45744.1 hypothetical protein [Candidatus Rifleibacterium sp.]
MPNSPNKSGSIFLLTLTAMTVLFIFGFSITFFTGSEDYASAMSYESEVAFNLAESAIEEFVARIKNSLNHDDSNNQLYKVLRSVSTDVTKEIPLEAAQVARLTAYTRETARQIYGIQFGRGLVESDDFVVDATIKLQHINAVEATNGDQVLYSIKKDLKEKQGEFEVRAKVTYKGHTAKVSLKFLIRVVKTFVPPFNYFTLFVKDGSVYGGSHFNTYTSSINQTQSLRLDNGWNAIKRDFNPTLNFDDWEKELAQLGGNAITPPGRIYLGQDLNSLNQAGPAVLIRSTNGAKLLFGDNLNSNVEKFTQMNAQDNFFLNFDVPWMGMKDYVKKFMKLQGQEKTKEGLIFTGWGNDHKIRIFNIGAGKELIEPNTSGPPSFINCFQSYAVHTGKMVTNTPGGMNSSEGLMKYRLMPELDRSGFDPFGSAPPLDRLEPMSRADFTKLSPTLIYGPAMRQYFRAVQIQPKDGEAMELPFTDSQGSLLPMANLKPGDKLNATQAVELLFHAVDPDFKKKIERNWDKLPDGITKLENYSNFMSDSGVELYNKGLANFINRLRNRQDEYEGPLKDFMGGYLENYPYPYNQVPKGMETVIGQTPMREFYEGALWHSLPDNYSTYLLDFYFIPRSTEDFFRGRTTVAMGGTSYDRFEFKYINNVEAYRSGQNNQSLELNGILALNDSEPLGLRNLRFRGHGVIYSSPMMGGGKVVIAGDLLGVGTDEKNIHSSIGNDLLTIIAPQILIDTTNAVGSRCYVEANLISVSEPLLVKGDKPVTIKGTVVTPFLNLQEHFATPGENIIVYNALNGIWRNMMPSLMDKQYVAKIVTGGVGKFDWKYERE